MVYNTVEKVAIAADAFAVNGKHYYVQPIDEATKIDDVLPELHRAFEENYTNTDRSQALEVADWFFVFSKWRIYKTVYRFDRLFFSALIETENTLFHQAAIKYLPINSFFVASPNEKDIGFFLYVETLESETFFMVISVDDVRGDQIHGAIDSMWIEDGQSIEEALKKWMDTINRGADYSAYYDRAQNNMKAAVQIVYYLSSQNADVSEVRIPKNRRPKRANGTTLNLKQWDVGFRIGKQFKEKRRDQKHAPIDDENKNIIDEREDRGNSPRPHVRRAHWHHYWAGQGKKTLILKWLEPIIVNGSIEEIIPTEHRVRRDLDR